MTSMLPEDQEGGNTAPAKQKFQTKKITNDNSKVRDETRSFLGFSRENLSISHSDLEQGFNRRRFRPRRHTILSTTAIFLALVCIGLEIWKLRCVVENAKEIDTLKRDVDSLKHRFLEEDLLDELKAFEEQLYAEEGNGDDDPDDEDLDNADYDSNYDDDPEGSQEYSGDYHSSSYSTQSAGTSEAGSDKDLEEVLAALHKVEAKRGQEFEKNVRENHKNIERDRLFEEEKHHKKRNHEKLENDERIARESSTEMSTKQKRSIPDEGPVGRSESGVPIYSSSYLRNKQNSSRDPVASRLRLYEGLTNGQTITTEQSVQSPVIHHEVITSWDRHPPKKYYAEMRAATAHVSPPSRHQNLENTQRRSGWRSQGPQALTFNEAVVSLKDGEVRKVVQDFDAPGRGPRRGMSRRHLRGPRQVFAAHYGADSTLFTDDDEHTGNGRARHGEGIFKAWRPSDWVNDLGMTRHFDLANDGKLTVHESGLYLIYAQIHYLDEHDENGFQVLVNGMPILQCMVYSPGIGHKSRSCFSAQMVLLQTEDRLVLKDIGQTRYTLFQPDKSFFGLVKLGDTKPPKQQQLQRN